MGSQQSTPLADVSCEELASKVTGLGSRYGDYGAAVIANAVDGELLEALSDTEFAETLDDLEITVRLHRRVLTKEWNSLKKWKERASLQQKKKKEPQSSSSLLSPQAAVDPVMRIAAEHSLVLCGEKEMNKTTDPVTGVKTTKLRTKRLKCKVCKIRKSMWVCQGCCQYPGLQVFICNSTDLACLKKHRREILETEEMLGPADESNDEELDDGDEESDDGDDEESVDSSAEG